MQELDEARRAVDAGNYKLAIRRLWDVEAWARDDSWLAEGLRETAGDLVQRTTGGLHGEAEELSPLAEAHIARLAVSPPETPHFRVGMPVSTSNDVAGWQVTEYLGEVFGLVVRSRGALPQIGANLKSVIGGELKTMTNLLRETRTAAIDRMVEEAERRGADAVIAMRFDVTAAGETAGWTEICAYGTAVRATKQSGGEQ